MEDELRTKISDLAVLVSWANIMVKFAFFSMQTYLTNVWSLSFTHAAAILNIWGGISWILPLFFLLLTESRVGDFKLILISSMANSVGIVLVTMSTPPILGSLTGTCEAYGAECIGETHKVVFYMGMGLVAVGIGGHRALLEPYSDDLEAHNCSATALVLFFGLTAGFIIFPYIKQWYILFGVAAFYVIFATVLFLCGWREYNSKPELQAQGRPLIGVCRVFVAAARKSFRPLPQLESRRFYKGDDDESHISFQSCRFLGWLEKAAVILPDVSVEDQARNKWKLCSVEQVEAAKFVARILPIGTTCIFCTVVSSAGNTFFVEQGSHMNRNLGKWKVPSQVLLALFVLGKKYLFDNLADYLIKNSGPPRGIAVAMLLSVLSCVTAGVIETERLKVVKRRASLLNKPDDEDVNITAYWLFFPFFLLAGVDSFLRKSFVALYQAGSPEPLRRYCGRFTDMLSGLGLMSSVLCVYVVGKISEMGGREGWFQESLNKSRLDMYYWVLAALAALNLLIFVPLAPLLNHPNREAIVYLDE